MSFCLSYWHATARTENNGLETVKLALKEVIYQSTLLVPELFFPQDKENLAACKSKESSLEASALIQGCDGARALS